MTLELTGTELVDLIDAALTEGNDIAQVFDVVNLVEGEELRQELVAA